MCSFECGIFHGENWRGGGSAIRSRMGATYAVAPSDEHAKRWLRDEGIAF
jgi:hypothetical protein